jgi:RNase P subunit RPR2
MKIVRNIKLKDNERLAICPSCHAVLLYRPEERTYRYGMNDYGLTIECKVCKEAIVVG